MNERSQLRHQRRASWHFQVLPTTVHATPARSISEEKFLSGYPQASVSYPIFPILSVWKLSSRLVGEQYYIQNQFFFSPPQR
jgi:hypothetical protein